ncbi:unnamed protein product [Callosobruchus maculatus]|uniref:Uncharacterized protein n=2 Tax=Callosobruchus maculatus TaxID=64391 RepID=A0A653C488_CALMS|nr:unnamed protein product [Callosobruchus maculatus]
MSLLVCPRAFRTNSYTNYSSAPDSTETHFSLVRIRISAMLKFLAISVLVRQFSYAQDISLMEDVHVLSELPLEKLLSIQKSFQDEECEANISRSDDIDITPQALALQGIKKKGVKDRGGYYHSHPPYHHHYDNEGGDSDKKGVQSFFQLSITALSFLAFGGYLLCLLVHAVRGKASYYNYNPNTMTQMMATYLAAKLKKRKNIRVPPRRRPNTIRLPQKIKKRRPNPQHKRKQQNQLYTRPKRNADIVELMLDDGMYDALVQLSEGYTKYHTINYVNYNHTHFK